MLFVLLFFSIIGISSAQFLSAENTTLPSNITVGNGSDVLIEVRCANETVTGVLYNWLFSNGSAVPDPLTAFGVSQNPKGGVLRIYPAPRIEEEDLQSFVCSVNGRNYSVTFTLCKNALPFSLKYLVILTLFLLLFLSGKSVLYQSSANCPGRNLSSRLFSSRPTPFKCNCYIKPSQFLL